MGLLLNDINKELLNVDTLLKEKYRKKDKTPTIYLKIFVSQVCCTIKIFITR